MTPDEIALNLGKGYIELLPLQKINQLLGLNRYGTIDLLRAKHLRVAQWLLNVFLLLLAISTVLTREPGKLKSSAFRMPGADGAVHGERIRHLPDGRQSAESRPGESVAGANGMDADIHLRAGVDLFDGADQNLNINAAAGTRREDGLPRVLSLVR